MNYINGIISWLYREKKTDKPEEPDLPSDYGNAQLNKVHLKNLYIAGFANQSSQPLSKLSTSILSVIKPGFRTSVTQHTLERCGSDMDTLILKNRFVYKQLKSLKPLKLYNKKILLIL